MATTIFMGIHILLIFMYFGYFFMVQTQTDSPMPRQVLGIISFGYLQVMGYTMLLGTRSEGGALASLRLQYTGGIYICSFLMFFAIRFCRKHIPQIFRSLVLAIDVVLVILIFTFPQTGLFISNMEFVAQPGKISYVMMTPGKLYYLSHLFAICQIAYGIWVIGDTIYKEKLTKSFNKYGWLLAALSLSILGYIQEALMTFTHSRYDLAPMCVGISVCIFFIAEYKKIIYDIEAIVDKSLLRNMEGAIVIADSNYAFVKANAAA